ncbi:MAG: N-acetylmuramidase family protein [Gammaproteobacteria bacterium]
MNVDCPGALGADAVKATIDYALAAGWIGCEAAVIQAVAEVESSGSGFLLDGRCKVIFEGYAFFSETKGRFAKTHPTLCFPEWTGEHYALGETPEARGAGEIARLERAMALDRSAALRSASYGKFRIMGFNHRLCMYPDVGMFYEAMKRDAASHLDAFCHLIKSLQLGGALKRKDWAAFALGYNGPGCARNDYAGRMTRAYERLSGT